MTLPYERVNAVNHTRAYLRKLLATPGRISKRELRREVGWLLKHYPTSLDMEDPRNAFEGRRAHR